MKKEEGTQSFEDLIDIHPGELFFSQSKSSSTFISTVKLTNVTSSPVAFKFKTNAPSRYSVKPVLGKVEPKSSVEVFVRCEEQVQDADRFMVQAVTLEKADKEVDAEFWRGVPKEKQRSKLMECKLRYDASGAIAPNTPGDAGSTLRQRKTGASNTATPATPHKSSSTLTKKKPARFGFKDVLLILALVFCMLLLSGRLYGWEWTQELKHQSEIYYDKARLTAEEYYHRAMAFKAHHGY